MSFADDAYAPIAGIECQAQGEADEYVLLRGSQWIAHIRMNGEFTAPEQEEILSSMLEHHATVYGEGFRSGLAAAAHYIERKVEGYDRENGITHPGGDRIYPAGGRQYLCELVDLADGIRAIKEPVSDGGAQ